MAPVSRAPRADSPGETARFTARLRVGDPPILPRESFLLLQHGWSAASPTPSLLFSYRSNFPSSGRSVRQDFRESKDPLSSALSRLSGREEPDVQPVQSSRFPLTLQPSGFYLFTCGRGAVFSCDVRGIGRTSRTRRPLRMYVRSLMRSVPQ